MIVKRWSLKTFCLLLLLSGCGGGGGSGEDEGFSSDGIRIVHGSIEAAPVDLTLDNDGVVQSARYAEVRGYRALGAGSHSINLVRSRIPSSPLFAGTLTTTGSQKFSLLLFGDRGQFGLKGVLIEDLPPVDIGDSAAIRLIHAAVGAGGVRLEFGGENLEARFGKASEYQVIPAGELNIRALRASDGQFISSTRATTEPGRAYSVLVAGEVDYANHIRIFAD